MKCHAGPVVRVNERLLVEPCKRHTNLWDIGTLLPPVPWHFHSFKCKSRENLALAGEAVNLSRRLIRTTKASSVHYLFLLNCQMMSFPTEASGHNVTTRSVTNHRVPRLDSRVPYTLVDDYGWARALLRHERDSGMRLWWWRGVSKLYNVCWPWC